MIKRCCRLAAALLILLGACDVGPRAGGKLINDFEARADLDRLSWKCRTAFARSTGHATRGRYALLVTMYPDAYPGVSFHLLPGQRDWSGCAQFAMDVFNPADTPVRWHYRVDDREAPPYADRVNGTLVLTPGGNRVRLGLDGLRTSGTGRPLRLERVEAVMFFLVSPKAPVRLFVDNVHLAGCGNRPE